MPESGVTDAEEFHHFGFAQILLAVGRCLFGSGLPDGSFKQMVGKVFEIPRRNLNGYAGAAILDDRLYVHSCSSFGRVMDFTARGP